jgi:hypothetical protein
MKKFFTAALASAVFIASPANATVTFDPGTGIGFVGKGDVQFAFGWNNAQMQARHLGVTFAVDESVSYDVTCEWTTVTGGKNSKTITHTVTNHRDVSSNAAVDSQSRRTGQYTGWHLLGYSGGSGPDSVHLPQVGDSCPQGGSASENDPAPNDAVVTAVDNVVGGGGTLTAYYLTDSRVIYTY